MHAPTRILVCFAVKEEARFFKRFVAAEPHIRVLLTGMGRKNAERSIRDALSDSKPSLVVSAGFAGGLRPDLKAGDILFSELSDTGLNSALLKAGAKAGNFYFSNRVATRAIDKQQMRESTGADAVEMESSVICATCQERGIPSATVRVVLDTAQEDLPLDFNLLLNKKDKLDALKLAFTLLKSPGKIGDLLRLRKQSELAAKELARILRMVLLD